MSLRKCSVAEGEVGQMMNSQTGKPFTPGDPCIEFGVSLQYDEAATAGTREAVKGVLASVFATERNKNQAGSEMVCFLLFLSLIIDFPVSCYR